jgi:hypothetical protein
VTLVAYGYYSGGGPNGPQQIAVDDANVYFSLNPTEANPPFAPAIMKVAKGGGYPVTLVAGAVASGLVVDATSVYWNNGTGQIMAVTPK